MHVWVAFLFSSLLALVGCSKGPSTAVKPASAKPKVSAAGGVVSQLRAAKVDSAKVQLRSIANGVALYQTSEGKLPTTLQAVVDGKYLKPELVKDPWKNDVVYQVAAAEPAGFSLCSQGPDSGSSKDDICYNEKVKTSSRKPVAVRTKVAAPQGKTYGGGVSQAEVVKISQILANPEKYQGKKVRVEGLVTDVCPKRGCWFEMASDKAYQIMRFKVRDGVMVFPMDAKGKYAVAEGVVRLRKLDLAQSKRWAAYQAKNYGKKLDPATITKPLTVVRLDGTGAVVRDKK